MTKTPAVLNVTPLIARRPSRQEAEDAVRTLLAWAGDDPTRPGLIDTPARVADAYGEYFSGYGSDPHAELAATFEDTANYDDMVMLAGIRFESHCEHHMAPFYGTADVAYIPNGRIVGLSKIVRVVEILSRRLQTQEALTCEIARAIAAGVATKGVAVAMRAEHHCMSMRGVRQHSVAAVTSHYLGRFETDEALRVRFSQATYRDAAKA